MSALSAVVIIPARYGSVRFPGKPLAPLAGQPLIQHVYEQAARASRVQEVIVATDDERIRQAVEQFGGRAVMTNPAARSGTERVAEAARKTDAQVIVNVQGDEPLVQPDMIDQLVDFLALHPAVPMASLMKRLERREDFASPHVVKVVVDGDGFALYFSRSPIPYERLELSKTPSPGSAPAWKHLGLYGYQRHFLLQFPQLDPTPLEQVEQLEQLRALEHGHRLKLLETVHDTIGVDTPDDLHRVEQRLAATRERLKRA